MSRQYEATIGLEVHAQLLTSTKMFCPCSTGFGEPPNSLTCPVCLGLPGALPVINRHAVELGIRAALALGCQINTHSVFARKNYFYPDLPKGYQISQFDKPLSSKGQLNLVLPDGSTRTAGITRLHLEEDAGKSIHGELPELKGQTGVDLNRAGVPLAEIVGEPDLHTPEEAQAYLKELRTILLYTRVCAGSLAEGNLRCDANVSVALKGSKELGTRTEVKNLNSFRFVRHAIAYEIKRQIEVLESGGKVELETRLYDPSKKITVVMRSKAEAHDYRYFPEPDLPPLEFEKTWVQEIQKSLPELPSQKRKRWEEDYGLALADASLLAAEPAVGAFFEKCVTLTKEPRTVKNWVMGEVLRMVNESGQPLDEAKITPELLGELLALINEGSISGKQAKDIFPRVFSEGASPKALVRELGLEQISDEGQLKEIIFKVLSENPKSVKDFKGGKQKALGALVGGVMKATQGKANPALLQKLLRQALAENGDD